MTFEYTWKNNEANFGPPLQKQVEGGAHITVEIILKKGNKYIALRRESIPGHEQPPHLKDNPKGLLFFCHNLIRYGESVEDCVRRIVKDQTGVGVKSSKVVYMDSFFQDKDKQWALIPHVIAEVDKIPKQGVYGNKIIEVVLFDKNAVPEDFAWWPKADLKQFIEDYDN